MEPEYDVVVIGGGFAGATAARECATRGLRTLVVEARDRLGGRTWTNRLSSGEVVELGGTYVHWLQPHVWSEITRYGLSEDLVEGAEPPDWALVPTASEHQWRSFSEFAQWEKVLLERLFEPSRTALPRAYDPLFARAEVGQFDSMTIRDRLDQLDLSNDENDYLCGLFSAESSCIAEEGSFLSLMRWWAVSGHSYDAMQEAVYGYKLRSGMERLLRAIISDGGAQVRLGTPVERVETTEEAVLVTTGDGVTASGAAAVVATPAGIWPRIDFRPALSPDRIAAAQEGLQAPRGSKIIAVLRGEPRRIYVQPRSGHPIAFMWTSHLRSPEEQVAVIFGSHWMDNPDDPEEVAAAVRDLLPGVEIVESMAGTYLEGDRFTNGAWPFLKPGQLTKLEPHVTFSRPEGRIAFATADIAPGWCGFIDGAIESGLHAARTVRKILQDARVPGGAFVP